MPAPNKIIVKILSFLLIIIGIFTFMIGIVKIRNYYHPYLYGFIFGGSGLLPGIFINQKLKCNLFLSISIAFVGIFLMTGSLINQSMPIEYNTYQIININKNQFRSSDTYMVFVEIDGESRTLRCSREFWSSIAKNRSIDLYIHKGRLGFDYISAKDDI